MNSTKTLSDSLLDFDKIIKTTPDKLYGFSEDEASFKSSLSKWSKKELLGHLIDSAANNHQRFVRMQHENNLSLPQYHQDHWVSTQLYQEREWNEIIELWKAYNSHILHVIKNLDKSTLNHSATFPEYGSKTLEWLIIDYVDHMEHHLKQMFK